MSCQIVDKKIVAFIADYIGHYLNVANGPRECTGADAFDPAWNGITAEIRMALKGQSKGECFDSDGFACAKAIHNNLFLMNYEAYNARYTKEKAEFNPDFEGYEPSEVVFHEGCKKDWAARLYWALSYFLYQCAEGDVAKSPLYLALERFQTSLAQHIAHETANSLGIEWGDIEA